jgi:hypothetical protein
LSPTNTSSYDTESSAETVGVAKAAAAAGTCKCITGKSAAKRAKTVTET